MGLVVKARESLLSTSSGYNNYRGILNLCVILLVLSNARAALENIIKYGILVDPVFLLKFIINNPTQWPALEIALSLNLFILASLFIEKFISINHGNNKQNVETQSTGYIEFGMIFINLSTLLLLPPVVIYKYDSHPVTNSVALFINCIIFLKLVSYHSMMFWCRDIKRPLGQQSATTRSFIKMYVPPRCEFKPIPTTQQVPLSDIVDKEQMNSQDEGIRKLYHHSGECYPNNLNLRNIYYFMVAPTLCYEFEYARTRRIRKSFLLKRIIEFFLLSQIIVALVQQWIIPIVQNSMIPVSQMHIIHILERLLKLAIPNHLLWLLHFYMFFHSYLNILAELLCFADREFYLDWWNSESVTYFWRAWNIPAHKWCIRHLYFPLLAFGSSKASAGVYVFIVSAFFHEYLLSLPWQMFRLWAFFGMLMQLPLSFIASNYLNKQMANVAIWLGLIIGQPVCLLMYYHDKL